MKVKLRIEFGNDIYDNSRKYIESKKVEWVNPLPEKGDAIRLDYDNDIYGFREVKENKNKNVNHILGNAFGFDNKIIEEDQTLTLVYSDEGELQYVLFFALVKTIDDKECGIYEYQELFKDNIISVFEDWLDELENQYDYIKDCKIIR